MIEIVGRNKTNFWIKINEIKGRHSKLW